MHHTRAKVWIRCTLALVAALCSTIVAEIRPARAGMFSISQQQEIEAGQQAAAQAVQEYGGVLPPNDPRSIRVRAIGMQFARMSSRTGIPYSYQVLNNDQILNAFACPGGPVFITKKLVDVASNDAELAYVLGHETGHIDHKHIVKAAEKQQPVALGVNILGSLMGRGKNANLAAGVGNFAFTLWQRGYSRKDEGEADAMGVRWMAWMGYDPRAAVSMLGKLGAGGGGGLSKYLSTHPAPQQRQKAVLQEIRGENLLAMAQRQGGARLWMNARPATSGRRRRL